MKNSFFLVIPAQESKPAKLKDFETKALENWLFELPTANPGLATRLLHDFITEFNTVRMPLQLRLDALEQMRPKFHIIEDYLRSRLMYKAFPKEDNELKILQVLAALEREFTIGYWMVLKELTHRQIGWFQGKNVALALQRCIKGLSSVVISHYMMCMPIPDWVWIDLHSLFKLSVKLKKDTIKVVDETNSVNKSSSPEECYRQILLLSLTRPTGLMQKEIQLVYGFIENLFPYFGLSGHAVEGQQMQFAVLTDEDKPPFTQLELSTKRDSATIYLNLSRLYKILENKEKFTSRSETRFSSMHVLKSHQEKPTSELLEYLEQRWLGIELQKNSLFSDRVDRYVAIGMAPAHGLQPTEMVEVNKYSAEGDEQEFLAQSESEKMLLSIFNKTGLLSVGNLISFRKAEAGSQSQNRSLAIVNELIVAKQTNKISFGINLLTTRYYPIQYALVKKADTDNLYKGLFYNADEQFGEASFLIVDNFMLKENTYVNMMLNKENVQLLLKNRINIGLGYWQFECQRVVMKQDDVQSPKKGYDFI